MAPHLMANIKFGVHILYRMKIMLILDFIMEYFFYPFKFGVSNAFNQKPYFTRKDNYFVKKLPFLATLINTGDDLIRNNFYRFRAFFRKASSTPESRAAIIDHVTPLPFYIFL